jgi:hypothetical protein
MFNSSFFFLSKYKEKGKGENYIKLKKKKKKHTPTQNMGGKGQERGRFRWLFEGAVQRWICLKTTLITVTSNLKNYSRKESTNCG